MPKRAQRLVFTASAPFSYALWLAVGLMGLMGLMGGCGGCAAARTPPGCTEGVFGVGYTLGYAVGYAVGYTVGYTFFRV